MLHDNMVFQPALPLRGVTANYGREVVQAVFQPALPLRGVTWTTSVPCTILPVISTRTPLAGSDFDVHPDRRAEVISTRTPLAGSDAVHPDHRVGGSISTRTPLAGSDSTWGSGTAVQQISTRTPLAGSDMSCSILVFPPSIFQPALPLRGVTWTRPCRARSCCHFNPHSPCGE